MTPCATGDQLRRFLREEMDRRDTEALAIHVEQCEACQQTLEKLTAVCTKIARTPSNPGGDERDASLIERLKSGGPPSFEPGKHAVVMGRGRRDSSILRSKRRTIPRLRSRDPIPGLCRRSRVSASSARSAVEAWAWSTRPRTSN